MVLEVSVELRYCRVERVSDAFVTVHNPCKSPLREKRSTTSRLLPRFPVKPPGRSTLPSSPEGPLTWTFREILQPVVPPHGRLSQRALGAGACLIPPPPSTSCYPERTRTMPEDGPRFPEHATVTAPRGWPFVCGPSPPHLGRPRPTSYLSPQPTMSPGDHRRQRSYYRCHLASMEALPGWMACGRSG